MKSDQYQKHLYLIINSLLNKAPIKEEFFKSIDAENNYLQCIYRLLALHYNFEVDDRFKKTSNQANDDNFGISQ